MAMCWVKYGRSLSTVYTPTYTVYTRIFAERKTSNLNAEIVGSAYIAHNNYNIITYVKNHHFDTNFKGSAYMRVGYYASIYGIPNL